MWLVHNGVPFDVAFALDDVPRAWMALRFSEFRGARLDIATLRLEAR
ncbi:MAG: hypothetical protein KGK11_07730 [Sphingomonadales bacterium]|nr:hypothetical protein [Sphingomonadales bacterium]